MGGVVCCGGDLCSVEWFMRMIKRKVSQYDIRSMIWHMIRQRNKS